MNTDQGADANRRGRFLRDGYGVFPAVLGPEMVFEAQRICDRHVAAMSAEDRARHRYTGSLISLQEDQRFARLIAWPETQHAFAALGYADNRWVAGFIINKPPASAALFWHQDCWWWDEPEAYAVEPTMLFAMYYLMDTNPERGCLRVVPGSHRRRHRLHDQLSAAHTDATSYEAEGSPALAAAEGEIDVPVRAGDLVVGDARVLHASHPNRSGERRTVLTLWYYSAAEGVSARIHRKFGTAHMYRGHKIYSEWKAQAVDEIRHLLPQPCGDGREPDWHRIPGSRLRY
ncbi:MAG: phytanoyl-CoA dioxygenase family protein [Gammaproteobacteria bacterium]